VTTRKRTFERRDRCHIDHPRPGGTPEIPYRAPFWAQPPSGRPVRRSKQGCLSYQRI